MDRVLYNEKEYVVNSFKNNFEIYRNTPMVIYGLGKSTGQIIREFPEYNIIGLMDEARAGETAYGKEVVTMQEAVNLHVGIIVIIARATNIPIIFRRIAQECDKYCIPVFDINGERQSVSIDPMDDLPAAYKDVRLDLIKNKIKKADVVSFDIFDTLLMRTILYPRDLFRLLENKIVKIMGDRFKGFVEKRIAAEHKLYEICQPTLIQIYQMISESSGYSQNECNRILQEEIALEKEVLVPREAVVSLYRLARDLEKAVYITSDMYLQKNTLLEILKLNGIDIDEDHLLVSNEEGCAKFNGLFKVLKEKSKGDNILHIGDNMEADIICAKRARIQHTFWIPSSIKMTEDGKAREILNSDKTLENRYVIGSFLASKLNDPFLYEKTDGKMLLENEYELGRYYLAPFTYAFINWMIKSANTDGIDELLLGSRDGYIVEKILNNIKAEHPERINFKYRYFYASRSVCLIAGLQNDMDILYAADLAFSGSDQELLQRRFCLAKDEILERKPEEDSKTYFLRHHDVIMKNAANARESYNRYLKKQGFKSGKKYGFFDFVSSGTCQMGICQFTGWDITGYYVSKFYDENKENLDIKAFYPIRCVYEKQQSIMENYLFMENIFTSFEPTLGAFDENGNPIFPDESRSEKQLTSLQKLHRGIVEGCKVFMEADPDLKIMDYNFADLFLRLLRHEFTIADMSYFTDNPLMDEFCNRQFEVSN